MYASGASGEGEEGMNKQGKGKIEYLDYTWNILTGCNHPCKDNYCYAAKIAKRFGSADSDGAFHFLGEPMYKQTKAGKTIIDPYPYGFAPTFHRYRLNEPAEIKKPSIIGVVYMGDLFGEWVPESWVEQVFHACEEASQHTYLFLTKNPERYGLLHDIPKNAWLGATVTNFEQLNNTYTMANMRPYNKTFLSIEPLSEPINFVWDRQHIDGLTGCRLGPIQKHNHLKFFDWIIIGQQTGPGAKPPKPEWVQSIIDQCRAANVPVFVKSPLYEQFPIQEWPEDLRKYMD
jgi:protein gp37